MKTKIDVARKLVRLLYYYLLVAFFTTFALFFLKQGSLSFENYLIIAVVMSISWFMREKSGNNVILFFTHVAMIAGVIIIEKTVAEKTVMAITVFVIMINTMKYNRNGGKLRKLDEIPWPIFLAGMLMYAFGLYMNNKEMLFTAYIIPVLLFITYLIVIYLDGVYDYFDRTNDISDLPVRRMMSVNSIIVVGIIVITLISIAISYLFNLDILMKGFLKGLLTVLGLFMLCIKFIYTLLLSALTGGSIRNTVVQRREEIKQITENNSFAESMTTIVVIVLIILAAGFVYYLVRRIVRFIIAKRRMPSDIVEQIVEKPHDQKEKRKTFVDVMKERMSLDERARRVYRDTVLKTGKPYVPGGSDTTLDIQKVIEHNSTYKVESITELYNEVRYSDMIPDRKTLLDMRKRAAKVKYYRGE
ncbi:MAG TPA: hypothetical protein DEO87_03250 [Lachnospiraceae bacterium]|nr:hypothetical protein [Lachnospiraceae bacterium]